MLLSVIPALPNISDLSDLGLFGALGFMTFRYFTGRNSRIIDESWELLESLVRSLQESNAKLIETNQELVIQLKELSQYHGN